EGDATGALRALTHENDACGPDPLTVSDTLQFGCAEEPLAQSLAQQRHRVTAERQADGRIIRHDALPFGGCCKQRPALFDVSGARWGRRQRQRLLGACHFPERQVSIAAHRRERTGCSECFEISAIEGGTLGKILDTLESPLAPRLLDTLRAFVRE